MTQQFIKLNTGAKEIQQSNPGGPDKQQKYLSKLIYPITLLPNLHKETIKRLEKLMYGFIGMANQIKLSRKY